MTNIRNLMSCSDFWFIVKDEDDYHFPGVFKTPHPQKIGYCLIPRYDAHNPHFLFTEIQLGKGKACNAQKVTMEFNGASETLWYRVVPCGGIKLCSAATCTYIASTRQTKSCTQHPKEKLMCSNEKLGECPVEFIYIWPENEDDKRRWITGITREASNDTNMNLHYHPNHAAFKIPSQIDTDI